MSQGRLSSVIVSSSPVPGSCVGPRPRSRSERASSFVRLDPVSVQPSDDADAEQYAADAAGVRPLFREPRGAAPAEQAVGAGAGAAALRAVRDAVRQR